MTNCPECGQAAAEDAKFCDRCGQGLAAAQRRPLVTPIAPLEPGVVLAHGYRITALMRQTSAENRYRAERATGDVLEVFELRERPGPTDHNQILAGEPVEYAARPAASESPTGPRAKTAELKRDDPNPPANGPTVAPTPRPPAVSPNPADNFAAGEAIAAGTLASADGGSALMLTEAIADAPREAPPPGDLGEVFGRVHALSLILDYPAILRAVDGFAENGRVYLVYRDEHLTALADRRGGFKMTESAALGLAIQLCQAVGFVHRRGLRVNDLCPTSVALGADGRVRLTGLDFVTNDNELQSEPVFNDGYTAPEIYRGKQVDKRADIFALGAVLYSCLTGERLEAETWREEAGPIRFYPPHVVTPALEEIVRRALLFDPAMRWATVEAFKLELVKLASCIQVRAAGLTDVGMVRELNEDAVMMVEYHRDSQIEPATGYLYVIADGMGGAEAGEVASALAVGAMREQVAGRLGQIAAGTVAPVLREAIEAANLQVLEYQVIHPEARGMGSTAVAALVVPPDVAIGWVGDSRAYLSQEGSLRQLSKDHSLVQRLVEIGQITAEEARHHEHKNVITRSLGARPNGPAGAEVVALRLKRGERIMLCSDGLTAHVSDAAIGEILSRQPEPAAAVRELVVAANAGGGTDNVSVIVILAG